MKVYYRTNWSGDQYIISCTPRGLRLYLQTKKKEAISSAIWIIKYGELAVLYKNPFELVNPNTTYGDLVIRDILTHGHLVKGSINRHYTKEKRGKTNYAKLRRSL